MADRSALADALHATAHAWTDPDHPPRVQAIADACDQSDLFTEDHATYAVNQQMDACVHADLQEAAHSAAGPHAAGLHLTGTAPLYGHAFIAYLLLRGTTVHLHNTPDERPLLHAVWEAVPEAPIRWKTHEEADQKDKSERPTYVLGPADEAIPADWQSTERPAVVVLDGHESADEREALAEDILVYDGRAPQHVGLIWAPDDLMPDAYLEAMAHLRAAIPAHDSLPGALQMQQAFLEAQDQPHAYAEDMTFLFSKGAPQIQDGAHVRWTPYDTPRDIATWYDAHADAVGPVLHRADLPEKLLPSAASTRHLGTLHRLDWWPPVVQQWAAWWETE